jgi:hypothetical protein
MTPPLVHDTENTATFREDDRSIADPQMKKSGADAPLNPYFPSLEILTVC